MKNKLTKKELITKELYYGIIPNPEYTLAGRREEIVRMEDFAQTIKNRLYKKFGGKKITKKIKSLVKKELKTILDEKIAMLDCVLNPANFKKILAGYIKKKK